MALCKKIAPLQFDPLLIVSIHTDSKIMSSQEKDSEHKTSFVQKILQWAHQPPAKNSFLLAKIHLIARILIITGKEFYKNELTIRSSALTYTILLSLVPMLAMSTAVVKGLGGGDQLREVVFGYIDTLERTNPIHHDIADVPLGHDGKAARELRSEAEEDSSITNHLRSAADQLFDYVDRTNFATLGTIGVLGILFSAVLVLSNIELSMNTIWQVSSGRSFLRKVTDYLTFLILLPLSINFGFAANTVLKNDALLNKMMGVLPTVWVQTSLLYFIPIFFISLTFFLIYIFFPHTKVHILPAFIGAIAAGLLWFVTQNLYIGLQVGVSKYNAIYGSFATLPLFLVWMFLGWVFILGGAQLAFACQRHKSYQLIEESHSPLQQLSAAIDILNLIFSSYNAEKQLKKLDLPDLCPGYKTELLFNSLDKLSTGHLIELSTKGRLFPAAPPQNIDFRQIFSAILGDSLPKTKGGITAARLIKQLDPILNKKFSVEEKYE